MHKAQQSCSYMINPVDDSSTHNYYTRGNTEERKEIMLKNLWEIENNPMFEDAKQTARKYVNLESSESSLDKSPAPVGLKSDSPVRRYVEQPKAKVSRVHKESPYGGLQKTPTRHLSVQEDDSPSNWIVIGSQSKHLPSDTSQAPAKKSTARQTLTTHNEGNSLCLPQGSYASNQTVEQLTKISAEELIRNYTNANFMPQK